MTAAEQAMLDGLSAQLNVEMLTTLQTYERLLTVILGEIAGADGIDKRLIAMARTQIEFGFMAAERAVRNATAVQEG